MEVVSHGLAEDERYCHLLLPPQPRHKTAPWATCVHNTTEVFSGRASRASCDSVLVKLSESSGVRAGNPCPTDDISYIVSRNIQVTPQCGRSAIMLLRHHRDNSGQHREPYEFSRSRKTCRIGAEGRSCCEPYRRLRPPMKIRHFDIDGLFSGPGLG